MNASVPRLTVEESGESALQRVKLARHPERPHAMDYIERLFDDFVEVHGDRRFADDAALICGFGVFQGQSVAVIGQQKGRDTKQALRRNFGMSKPEGYRKALRLMRLAEKFQRPLLTLIDTQGAYPGIDAEERGQSEAIALNLREMSRLKIPTIATIIGEGGSGGALAIGIADRVLMMENAIYSVITPEGCAAILWKAEAAEVASRQDVVGRAARALRLTAQDLLRLRVIDEIVTEPHGGAHVSYDESAQTLGAAIRRSFSELSALSLQERSDLRYDKFKKMGFWRQ